MAKNRKKSKRIQLYASLAAVAVLAIALGVLLGGLMGSFTPQSVHAANIRGIEAIPVGQHEAASVLGFTRPQTFFQIILPQVVKRILPPVTNEVITLVKDTSLAFALSVMEMFTIAKMEASAHTTMVPFLVAGALYYLFNYAVASAMERAEKALAYYH